MPIEDIIELTKEFKGSQPIKDFPKLDHLDITKFIEMLKNNGVYIDTELSKKIMKYGDKFFKPISLLEPTPEKWKGLLLSGETADFPVTLWALLLEGDDILIRIENYHRLNPTLNNSMGYKLTKEDEIYRFGIKAHFKYSGANNEAGLGLIVKTKEIINKIYKN